MSERIDKIKADLVWADAKVLCHPPFIADDMRKVIADHEAEITALTESRDKAEERVKELTAERGRLREAAFKAIDDEPEYPGEMPDAMWDELKDSLDKETVSEALRITVRLTKQGIRNRAKAALAEGGGDWLWDGRKP